MTVWDNIYKNYQKGGEAWATLSADINPRFKDFLANSSFKTKSVLDIGCGTGKYLKFLQELGFETAGIDSSETAVEMTKKLLDDNSNIVCANMFEFDIPKNKYDLIISVAAIHHGTKDQVRALIDKIHAAITKETKIFITVPDFERSKKWDTFKNKEEIGKGAFVPLAGPEKGLPHSFYTKEEVQDLFVKFKNLQLELDDTGRWMVLASK